MPVGRPINHPHVPTVGPSVFLVWRDDGKLITVCDSKASANHEVSTYTKNREYGITEWSVTSHVPQQ